MLKKIISIVPVAILSATLGANAQAATITVQKEILFGIYLVHIILL